MIDFVVLGYPQPAGSKRAFAIKRNGVPTGQVAVTDANPRSKSWQAMVRDAAHEAFGERPLLTGPLFLSATFVFARPAGHYGSGRNANVVRRSAPSMPITRPDTTKLLRGLEDALTGLVWRDDAQVVVQVARKVYGSPERCEVTITPVDSVSVDMDQDLAQLALGT